VRERHKWRQREEVFAGARPRHGSPEREREGVAGSLSPRPLGVDSGHPSGRISLFFFWFVGNVAFATETHGWVSSTVGLVKPSGSIFAQVRHGRERRQ
jgi:hypothetical protein